MGMVGVDKIGEIRRAYFEQERPIKEIVRTLSVSRATVRKIIRGHQTEFKYARDVQPTPKLGVWVDSEDGLLGFRSDVSRRPFCPRARSLPYWTPAGPSPTTPS